MRNRHGWIWMAAVLLCVVMSIPWAGLSHNTAGAVPASRQGCGDPATLIHDIQGSEDVSSLGFSAHTIEGVVVGDFQDVATGLGGFFVQEEDTDMDADPLTSEGIFVFDRGFGVDVTVGDVVRAEGKVAEASSSGAFLTELRNISAVTVCGSASAAPVTVTLPVENVTDWERYEGMLVVILQELTVAENYDLGRYGQMLLAQGGRLTIPTNVVAPGAAANALAEDNLKRQITLDDGSNQENPAIVPYPAPGLSANNTVRAGDTVSNLTGVVSHEFGLYRIHATATPTFIPSNSRPGAPDPVGGTLAVASFNVLNYFNGDGAGGGFPTSRGASTPAEFARQRDKIINAILALDADVIGLIEIENDGDGPDSAIADLVNGLNTIAGEGVYAYIPDPDGYPLPIPDSDEGGDEIKQALVYRPAAVQPVGPPVTTLASPFDIRRPPVAQAFEEIATGEVFTVVVNHLKSKSCTAVRPDSADQGDGQGCWNQERVQAAATLIDWLATDPTGSSDPDVLIIGDLNAYAMEDPLMALQGGGYTNLLKRFVGDADYSYIYFGEVGTLDHALASASLNDQVTGALLWHINADEPRVLDYNEEYKSEEQITAFYSDDAYRSSDHDPVLVGLELGQ
ncbi:MAG: ExeM/NucH family extracellular endonuclease [Anaerolineae bacterium]|nr:ExeM/NucH family extracellular endonuclease [Anaerolineae bacterium]